MDSPSAPDVKYEPWWLFPLELLVCGLVGAIGTVLSLVGGVLMGTAIRWLIQNW